MPHMLSACLACARRASLEHGALEHLLVTLCTPAYEVFLDALQIIAPNLGAALRRVAQCAHPIVECLGIVERHHVAGCGCRQEVGLSTAVVTNDGQPESHCLEKNQSEALVLTSRNEHVGSA